MLIKDKIKTVFCATFDNKTTKYRITIQDNIIQQPYITKKLLCTETQQPVYFKYLYSCSFKTAH